MRVRFGVMAAGLLSAMVWGCGGGNDVQPSVGPTDSGPTDAGTDAGQDAGDAGCPNGFPCPGQIPDAGPDAGTVDAGTDAGPVDAGTDAGPVDAGTDAGPVDAGTDGGVTIGVPNSAGWQFLQAADGLNSGEVMGASVDEAGNLWVAGGTDGLFVLRKGDAQFQQFGLSDGLHPFGYMADGSPADLNPFLQAISVAGGTAGNAYVGYMGKTPADPSQLPCENNWDELNGSVPDPAIYKSGDADHVTLNGSGITVAHYDIFSGPGVVKNEQKGREKLCNIFRIVYEHGTNNLWFGANHGFAWGNATFTGAPTCDGELNCTGSFEHVHPSVNDQEGNGLTGDYRGVSLDLVVPHDVWFGGIIRSTRFKYGTFDGDFFVKAEQGTENDLSNQFDVWPDKVEVDPADSDIVPDNVSGMAAMPDGSVFVASYDFTLRHIARDGTFIEDIPMQASHLSALVRDPEDGSLWAGYEGFGLGVSQLVPTANGWQRIDYNANILGAAADLQVNDIQIDEFTKTVDTTVTHNRVIISFGPGNDPSTQGIPNVVAIHTAQ
jgi:hypothetical protein